LGNRLVLASVSGMLEIFDDDHAISPLTVPTTEKEKEKDPSKPFHPS
jgi:hypothetical protein